MPLRGNVAGGGGDGGEGGIDLPGVCPAQTTHSAVAPRPETAEVGARTAFPTRHAGHLLLLLLTGKPQGGRVCPGFGAPDFL